MLLGFLKFFFISWNSFSTLFIIMDSSRLIFESIKALEIKMSILFNLDFANNTILCFFLFFLIIDLSFLIILQLLHKFLILLYNLQFLEELRLKKQKEKGKHIQYCRNYNKWVINIIQNSTYCFYASYSLIHFDLFFELNNFLFHLFFSIYILGLCFLQAWLYILIFFYIINETKNFQYCNWLFSVNIF